MPKLKVGDVIVGRFPFFIEGGSLHKETWTAIVRRTAFIPSWGSRYHFQIMQTKQIAHYQATLIDALLLQGHLRFADKLTALVLTGEAKLNQNS